MIRGTTAQFIFQSPYPKSELDWITVKFWQENNPNRYLPITKTIDDCATTDNPCELCFSLTAEETSRFSDKYTAKVQLRALHRQSGATFGCKTKFITVYPMSDDIIGENPEMPEQSGYGFTVFDGQTINP